MLNNPANQSIKAFYYAELARLRLFLDQLAGFKADKSLYEIPATFDVIRNLLVNEI